MAGFDDKECWRRYEALRAAEPGHFANPPDNLVEILFDPAERKAAQAAEWRRRQAAGLTDDDLRLGILAEDHYIGAVTRDAVRFPGDRLGIYNRIIGHDGCLVLPLLGDCVVLIRVFRHPSRRWFWELPGGSVADPVHAEDAARAELREEIQAEPREMYSLGTLYPVPALSSERYHLFAARIDGFGAPQLSEGISAVAAIPVVQMEEWMLSGEICDGPTQLAFHRARLMNLI